MGMVRGLTGLAKKAINKRGRLKASEKAALTKAAKQNDMSVTEFRKAAKADLASEAGEGSASDKAVAKRLKISVAELQKKRKAAKKKKKTPKKWQRSKKERAELARLKSQQRKEDLGDQFKGAGMHGGRREETVRAAPGRTGLQKPHIVESPSGRLKSKQIIDTDDWTKTEKFRQRRQPHADPQSQIAEAMGLRGEGSLPTAAEARALGLTVKKGGGIVVDAKFGKFVKGLISKAKKAVTPKKPSTYGIGGFKAEMSQLKKQLREDVPKKTTKQKLSTKSRPKKKYTLSQLQKMGASPAKIKQWRIEQAQKKTPTQRVADRKKFEEKAGIKLSKRPVKLPKKKADEARKALGLKKKHVPKPILLTQTARQKMKGKSAFDIHKAYTIPEINKMKEGIAGLSRTWMQAGTPDANLIKRLDKAIAIRKKVKKKAGGKGMIKKAKFGKLIRSLKGKLKKTPKKKYQYPTSAEIKARKAKGAEKAAKRKAAIAKYKKDQQQLKISEALRGAKVADRSKKTSQVAKRVLPHVSQVRNKLKGMSADDLAGKYTGKELKAMEMKLNKAATPNKALLKRITKARDFRKGMIDASQSTDTWEALGLPAKWKKSGGAIKRNRGGAVRGVGKATRGFGNAKYSKKLY
jgi:hypothetical protein